MGGVERSGVRVGSEEIFVLREVSKTSEISNLLTFSRISEIIIIITNFCVSKQEIGLTVLLKYRPYIYINKI